MIKHDEKNVEGLIFRNSKPLKRKLSRGMKRKNGNYLSLAYKERV